MANQTGNGRNEDNRWRSDDDSMHVRNRDDEERMYRGRARDDERFMQRDRERSAASWDDRSGHSWDRDDDRSVGWRSIDRGGMGQSGYGAGREQDRSFQSRNPSYPPSWDDRSRERGVDERFAVGRGMSGQPGGYLGQGGQQMGWEQPWGNNMGHGDQNTNMGYGGGGGMQGGGWQRHEQPLSYGQNMYQNTAYGPGHFLHHRGDYGYNYDQRRDTMGHAYGSRTDRQWDAQRSPEHPQWSREQWRPEEREHHESLGQRIKGWFQGHRGKGPMGYQRSDERIRESVCEVLSDDDRVDASNIEVSVKNGEVTLSGTVEDRHTKRMAEDCIEHLPGVKDVQNNIRVVQEQRRMSGAASGSSLETPPTTTGSNGSDKRHRA